LAREVAGPGRGPRDEQRLDAFGLEVAGEIEHRALEPAGVVEGMGGAREERDPQASLRYAAPYRGMSGWGLKASARSRAPDQSRARSPSWPASRATASPSAPGSRTTSPLFSSSTISRVPPVSIAAIGVPSASASRSTRESGSGQSDGNTSAVARAIDRNTSSPWAQPRRTRDT